MNDAPYDYNHVNTDNAYLVPSAVNVQNSWLTNFFRRYLLQKAISVFKWNIPEFWSKDYFLYSLFGLGFVAVVNTNKYGVIPQHCSLGGYDIFYRPTHAYIGNPLLSGIMQPQINKQCTLIRLQPDYGSIMDMVNYYAGMMALCAQAGQTNLINSKLAYVAFVDSKAEAETFKKAFDAIISGEPMVVFDKGGKSKSDSKNWELFAQNVGQNYIFGQILADWKKLDQMYLTQIGLGNANTDKKERLIVAEVESNNEETVTMAGLWLEQLQEDCKKTREMFGIEISVDWRNKPEEGEKTGDEVKKKEDEDNG